MKLFIISNNRPHTRRSLGSRVRICSRSASEASRNHHFFGCLSEAFSCAHAWNCIAFSHEPPHWNETCFSELRSSKLGFHPRAHGSMIWPGVQNILCAAHPANSTSAVDFPELEEQLAIQRAGLFHRFHIECTLQSERDTRNTVVSFGQGVSPCVFECQAGKLSMNGPLGMIAGSLRQLRPDRKLFIYLSIYLFIYLFILFILYLSIYLYIYIYM